MKIPLQCREDRYQFAFDTIDECIQYYKNDMVTNSTQSDSTVEVVKNLNAVEIALASSLGVVGFLFFTLVVYVVKQKWECNSICQFNTNIDCSCLVEAFERLLELLFNFMTSSETYSVGDDFEDIQLGEPNTPIATSSTSDEPIYAVPNIPVLPPVAAPRRLLPPAYDHIETPVHPPTSPAFFTPANNDYIPVDSSEDSIESMETPARPSSDELTINASISSTDFPCRSMDMILPNPSPPNHGPQSLPGQYYTPAYQPETNGTLHLDETRNQFEETSMVEINPNDESTEMNEVAIAPLHLDETRNQFEETSIVEINPNNESNEMNEIEVESSGAPSAIIERRTIADITHDLTSNPADTAFLDETNETPAEHHADETEQDITEEITDEQKDEATEKDIQELEDDQNDETVDNSTEKVDERNDETEEIHSNDSSANSVTSSEYQREVRRQRRLAKLAKDLKSEVKYE